MALQVDEQSLTRVVLRVMQELEHRHGRQDLGIGGIYGRLDDAVAAAATAQEQLMSLSREQRGQLIAAMRAAALQQAAVLAEMAARETGMGRVPDKVAKNRLVATRTPGIEDLDTGAWSGDHGLTIVEMAPFGVIGAITPVTNPTATIINNAIGMVAAGNAVVFSPHPTGRLAANRTIEVLSQAIVEAGGPANLLTGVREPSIEVAEQLMRHAGINLLVATGGPAVVRAAMSSGKKAIGAGAGNPPVLVDATSDIRKAGRDVVLGAGFDNNLPCIAEKVIIVEDQVAEPFMAQMEANGARRLTPAEADAVKARVLTDKAGAGAVPCTRSEEILRRYAIDKAVVGKSAAHILKAAEVRVSGDPRIAFYEADRHDPLAVHEQMLPVLPVVRAADVHEGMRLAVELERGNRHTAVMFSRNVDSMTALARAIKATIFVKNGPSYAGIGLGGEGYTSFTIAGPTGEGLTSARTFTRRRHCILVDGFSIV